MPKKPPNPTDRHVGQRVRMRRMMMSMSQEKLGEALGLTFQQVQKYEKGTNRIGASRLEQLSHILEVPVTFFFEGLPVANMGEAALPMHAVDDFTTSAVGIRIISAFHKIPNQKLRATIANLIEQIAEAEAIEPNARAADRTIVLPNRM